jgi:hypothetical protein
MVHSPKRAKKKKSQQKGEREEENGYRGQREKQLLFVLASFFTFVIFCTEGAGCLGTQPR